jgi:hypothetical protein
MEMGNKPSRVRQREIQQIIRGARNEGLKQIELHIGEEASVIIPLQDEQKPVAEEEQITL